MSKWIAARLYPSQNRRKNAWLLLSFKSFFFFFTSWAASIKGTHLYIRTLPPQNFLTCQRFQKTQTRVLTIEEDRVREQNPQNLFRQGTSSSSFGLFVSWGAWLDVPSLGFSKLEKKAFKSWGRFHRDSHIPEFDLCYIWVLQPKTLPFLLFTCSCCYHPNQGSPNSSRVFLLSWHLLFLLLPWFLGLLNFSTSLNAMDPISVFRSWWNTNEKTKSGWRSTTLAFLWRLFACHLNLPH